MIEATEYEEVTQIRMSRYPELQPPTFVSAYLVDGLLIDTGLAYTAEELADFLKDKVVKKVVNTHHHEDHIAGNALLKERYGTKLLAHPLAVNKINQPATLYPYQQEVWGYPTPSQVEKVGNHVTTPNFRFKVIHTPGHDRDHICLFEKSKGWLFTGDLFATTHPTVARSHEDQWQIIADLKKLKKLAPRVMFTAPVARIIIEPAVVLEQTIQYLEDLGRKITELNRNGLSSVEITQQIFGSDDVFAEFTQQQFSSLNVVKSFLKES